MTALDSVVLDFDPGALAFINWMLALVVFGVALDLRLSDFARVITKPRAPAIGMLSQFLLMPALATGLVWLASPPPSVALGIILVAACPGGTVSNFMTSLGRGDAALSVTMSAVSTLGAVAMTPFNFALWANIYPPTAPLLQEISLNPLDMFRSVATILVFPTVFGMLLAAHVPRVAKALHTPMRVLSLLVMFGFITAAATRNSDYLVEFLQAAFGIVLVVNGCALALGYGLSRAGGLSVREARAVSFETGIQNSGFGLVLVFNFFSGLGGMAIVVAWWGVWHLITGLSLARYWSQRPPVDVRDAAVAADTVP